MDTNLSKTGWDVFMFGIPLIAFLILGFFRLDEVFASRKQGATAPRSVAPRSEIQDKSMHSDPDGRPWDDE